MKNIALSGACALFATGALIDVAGAATLPALSAQQIVDRNVAARGGAPAWKAVQTMSYSGKLEAGKKRPLPTGDTSAKRSARQQQEDLAKVTPVELPFLFEYKRGRKQRLEVQFNGQTAVQVYDGTSGWKVRPFLANKAAQPFSAEEARIAAEQPDLDGPLMDYAAKGTRVEAEGVEAVEGHDNYKLKLTFKDGQVRHLWIDGQTFLESRIDGVRTMDGKPRTVWSYYRDYRSVNGLMIPYAMETSVQGVPDSERMRVDTVALNTKMDDALFAKP